MHNVIELEQMDEDRELRLPQNAFSFSNTKSNDYYTKKCKEQGVIPHPARMQPELVNFFIEFLTDEGDIVLDPFGGSNTTGFCAEKLKRRWISIEANEDYGIQSMIRFADPVLGSVIIKRGE